MVQALRVRLLGGLEVEGVETVRLGSRKARRLLKLLALARGAAVPLDVLVDALWPESLPANPADQVSVLVSRLRRVLGTDRIRRVDAGYALAVDWLDVTALGELVDEAERRWRSGGMAPVRAAARAALALARGPVLPDEADAGWVTADRAEAERRVNRARMLLGEAALVAGDAWEAVEPARRALRANPYDEEALRLLMSAYAATDRPALALAAYAEAAARLADELGSDPAPATAALHLDILRGGGKPVAPPHPATAGRPELPGREKELAALDAALADACAGQLGFVVIEGEPGIGKTSLLQTWLAAAPDTDAIVLRAQGNEPGNGLPLDPVLSVLAAHVSTLDDEAALELLGPESEVLGPLLGQAVRSLLGQAERESAARRLTRTDLDSGRTGRLVLFSALEAVLSRMSAESVVILAVDDAHLVDAMTAEWLHHCARRLPDSRLLVLVARRPDEGPGYTGRVRLPLGALDREAAAAVVGGDRVDDLYERSGGHPLFLVELGRYPGDELPGSIRVVAARYCERSGAAAATLRAAAVLGPSVDLDLLAHVLDRPPSELLDDLETGVRRHLLIEHRDGFVFTHRLLRDSLEADTSGPRRALLHRQAARVLAGRAQPDPLRVAHHARLGGDFPLAASALSDSAEIALARFDYDGALRLSGEAVELDDAGSLRLRRARIRLAAGGYRDAASDAGAALAMGEGAAALEVAAQAAYHLREFPRALRLAEDGVALAGDPETRAACAILAGRTEIATGRLDRAQTWLTGPDARTCQPVRAVADLHLALLRNQQGSGHAALSVLAEEGALRRTQHPFVRPHRHLQEGHALALAGRPVEALAAFERLERVAEQEGTRRFAGRGANFRAWILRNLGAHAEADDCNERAFEQAARYDIAEPRSHALLDLAEGRLRADDLDGAGALLRRAADEGAVVHALRWRHRIRLQLLSGRLALARGAAEEARAASLEVRDDAKRMGLRRYEVLADVLLARAAAATGAPAAIELVDASVADLGQVAALEAWHVTADLARDYRVDAWSRLAAERARELARRAGPWRNHLDGAAARVLAGMPT